MSAMNDIPRNNAPGNGTPGNGTPGNGTPGRKITGKHVLVAMLAFFGLIIAVNATFVYLSLTTWTGLVSSNAYVEGLAYNATLEDAARQRQLGWKPSLQISSEAAGVGRKTNITVIFSDRHATPINGLTIDAELRHPILDTGDLALAFQAMPDGAYRAQIDLPRAGSWKLRLIARRSDGATFRLDKDLSIE